MQASPHPLAQLAWICLGGAIGTGARFLLSGWIQRATSATGATLPYGTLTVNLLGSFIIGILMCIAITTHRFSPTVQLALTAGVMGGFTTYSSFAFETLRALQAEQITTAFLYIALTVIACLLTCWLGWTATAALIRSL